MGAKAPKKRKTKLGNCKTRSPPDHTKPTGQDSDPQMCNRTGHLELILRFSNPRFFAQKTAQNKKHPTRKLQKTVAPRPHQANRRGLKHPNVQGNVPQMYKKDDSRNNFAFAMQGVALVWLRQNCGEKQEFCLMNAFFWD